MLKIYLYENIQNSESQDLAYARGKEVDIGCQNEEILKFVSSRLLKSLI